MSTAAGDSARRRRRAPDPPPPARRVVLEHPTFDELCRDMGLVPNLPPCSPGCVVCQRNGARP